MSDNLIKETFVCYRKDLSVVEKEWKIMDEKEILKDVAQFEHAGEEEEKLFEKLKMMPIKLLKAANDQKIECSNKLKQAANLMTHRDVIGALMLYTEILTNCNDEGNLYTILVKRSDCLVQLNEYEKSLKDLQRALQLNKVGTIPYFRSVRCYINLGLVDKAEEFLNAHKKVFAGNHVTLKFRNDIQKVRNVHDDVYENSRNYQKCLDLLNKGLELAPASVELMIFKIKYLVITKKLEEAKEVDKNINKRYGKNLRVLDAFQNYYECNFDKCNMETKLNMRVVDDMMDKAAEFKINFEFVKTEIFAKNYEEAVSVLHELYECDDSNRKAYLKICEMLLACYSNMKQDDNIIKYATEILKVKPHEVNVLMARAYALVKIKLFDKAARDFKALLNIKDISNDLRSELEDFLTDTEQIRDLEEQKRKAEIERARQKQEADEKAKKAQEKAKRETSKNSINFKKAEAFNDNGNNQYKSKLYATAIHYYSDAIQLCPNIVKYYTNRCASYMCLVNYDAAVRDAVKAVDVDPSFWKGYSRAINCFMILGNIRQARVYIEKMQNNIAGVDSIKFNEIPKVEKLENHHKEIVKAMDEKNFDECLKHLEAALKIATACKDYDFWRAECLIMMGKDYESQTLEGKYRKEPYVIYLKGLHNFVHNQVSMSLSYFQEALKLDPEFKKASTYKRIVADVQKLLSDVSKTNNVRESIAAYTAIIDYKHDNIHLKFKAYYKRAELHFNSQNFQKAFEDCSMALRLKIDEKNDFVIRALILRAKIHCKQKEFEDAVIDCDEILRIIGNDSKYKDEVDVLRKDAKHSSLHRDVRNYYEILRITRNAPMVVIKEAFKNLSRLYHTDKHPDATAVEKKKLEIRFQEIRTAFECLKVQHEC